MFALWPHPLRLPLAGVLRIRPARHAGLSFLLFAFAPLALAFFAQGLRLELVPVAFNVLEPVALLVFPHAR